MTQVMPDLLKELLAYLAADIPSCDTFSADLTGYTAGDRWVEIIEAPGIVNIPGRQHQPSFDFNCYGVDLQDSRSLAHEVLAAVMRMLNHTTSELVVTFVENTVTPFKLTDLFNNQSRYVFTMAISYRPN